MPEKGKLGLKEVVAMGVGGMVSGGIFAVLGVAMLQAGNAVALSFLLAGILTLVTSYSYLKLTLHFREEGGVFTFLEHVVENRSVAGFFGWVLIVGYVGVMAMYAFAFGSYLAGMFGFSSGSILRRMLSVTIVAVFVGLNLWGVRESSIYQDIAVYVKITLLLSVAMIGIVFSANIGQVTANFFDKGVLSPIAAFAIIFVSYEGFELLAYDYRDIRNVEVNLPRGMLISIVIAILIYVSVSFMATLYLTPQQLIAQKEYALAEAVTPFLGAAGFVVIVFLALQSTSSGINATLFGTARLTHRIATEDELPRVFSFRNKRDIPTYSLLLMGGLTAAFTFAGTLEEITTFGSIVFLTADAVANYTNLRAYKRTKSNVLVPAAGLGGCLVAILIVVYHLFMHQPGTLVVIIAVFAVLFFIEFLYIKRKKGA